VLIQGRRFTKDNEDVMAGGEDTLVIGELARIHHQDDVQKEID
jgi:mitogen-activated protein kinase 1/3